MATQQGSVVKTYEIRVTGFDQAQAEFNKMSVQLDRLKKQKLDLDKALASTADASKVADLTKKQQEQTIAVMTLTEKLKERKNELKALEAVEKSQANGTDAALQAYRKLVAAYSEAKANSEAMEAQFGKESTQAIEAAKAFVIYESELKKINNLKKSNLKEGNGSTPAPEVPFTHNLNADGTVIQPGLTDATTAVTEFDKAQAEAAISAKEFGDSQKKVTEDVKATGPAFTAIKGSLDQYSGTLRENIKAQIENVNSLAINKAAQKEIQDAIKASGSATETQVEKLAALKEEALVLDQTNKGLTTTIRNQAKEFISASGSIEEGRAKVNQLQQAYEGLSEAERASPFGVQLKNDIDVLEPKVKELEATIGKFQRSVGNYPKNFTGAFTVLEKELDSLQGKLVSGNFKGKEFDELTKKTALLSTVTKTLGGEFKSTAAERNAFKEAAKQVGAVFGTDSEVFKNFGKAIGEGNKNLKETDKALNVVSGAGKGATGVFKTLYNAIRNIANIVPGLGLSGAILLLITPLQALAASVIDYFTQLDVAKEKAKLLNDVNIQSIDIFNKEKTQVEELASVAKDHSISLNARKEALNQIIAISPEYLKGLTLENINTAEGTRLLDAYVISLQKKADVQAATSVATDATKVVADLKAEKQALLDLSKNGKVYYDDLSEAQQKFIDAKNFLGFRATASIVNARLDAGEINRVANNIDDAIKKAEIKVTDSGQVFKDKFKAAFTDPGTTKGIIEKLRDQIKVLTDTQPTLLTDAEIKTNVAQIKKLEDQLNALLGKTPRTHADRLNTDEQNQIKIIDASLKQQLAIENTRVNEIEKVHALDYDQEIFHLARVKQINTEALDSKIALLSKQKHLNAEELATLADFKEKRSSIELQTSKQIQDIEKKRFADQDKELQASLSANIEQAKNAQKDVLENPDLTNIEKARATLNFIDTEIVAYKTYYNQLLELNSNYNDEALQKVRDHLKGLQRERSGGQRDEVLSTEKDIQAQGEKDITQINIQYAHIRNSILSNRRKRNEFEGY